MTSNQPVIILVEPQLAENVGMAARAMMNCGLYQMRLVNPREDHLSDKAISASSNAESILEKATVYPTTEAAVADLDIVMATTARHRDQTKAVHTAGNAAIIINKKQQNGIKCGLMFGPERSGLTNNDVCLADAIINIPLNPEHCSLNLSQAVLLVGFEYYKTQIAAPEAQFVTNHSTLANKGKIISFCQYMEKELENCGNFKIGEKRDKMVINLRNIFTRAQLTEQELNTLYGVFNHINKN